MPTKTKGRPGPNLSYRIWVLSYSVEEARQRYAERRQLLRQAGACLVLALLRLAGVIRA